MRWLILILLAVWGLLTAFGYSVVLPDRSRDEDIIRAYWMVASEAGAGDEKHGRAADGKPVALEVVDAFVKANPVVDGKPLPPVGELLSFSKEGQAVYLKAFREWYNANHSKRLDQAPALVWSTDDNPARRVQCQLFRAWYLRTYGEPVDIIPDPTNRDITKTIVQCVAGAGPDIIEAYGPAELGQMVSAGVALDVTDAAKAGGFGTETVFAAAVSSIAVEENKQLRQYAYPCNVGYTVVFYHRDLFRQAGVPEPTKALTIDELVAASKKLMAADPSGRRVGIMGLGAWGMALWGGNGFFTKDGTASIFNNPKTVAAFKAYQDLMYVQKVMPTPAEAASMASSGGANMNAGAESASASALFAAKVAAMVTDGRWSYVSLAQRNRDRVIAPAVRRKLEELRGQRSVEAERERGLLESGLASLMTDVLVPISPSAFAAIKGCLNEDDRKLLIDVGVMHTPTMDGVPSYEAAARVAIINRVSPKREYAERFLKFLASAEYNNQINYTFDSICGVPKFCDEGIAGPPEALPGLEAFDSPVFVSAMEKYAFPWELSPFIGRARLGMIATPIMERLTNKTITPEDAAKEIEDGLNEQIRANLVRDPELRAEWERKTGRKFDAGKGMREQVEVGGKGQSSNGKWQSRRMKESEPQRAQRAQRRGREGWRLDSRDLGAASLCGHCVAVVNVPGVDLEGAVACDATVGTRLRFVLVGGRA